MQGTIVVLMALSGLGCHHKHCDVLPGRSGVLFERLLRRLLRWRRWRLGRRLLWRRLLWRLSFTMACYGGGWDACYGGVLQFGRLAAVTAVIGKAQLIISLIVHCHGKISG